MIVARNYLQSRVGRRVLLLFVIAALIPASVSTVIEHRKTRESLLQHSQIQLQAVSKGLSQAIVARLEMLAHLTRHMAQSEFADSDSPAETRQVDIGPVRNVGVIRENADGSRLARLAAPTLRPGTAIGSLDPGSPFISEMFDDLSAPRLSIGRRLATGNDHNAILLATLDPDALFADTQPFPNISHYCVLGVNRAPLSCSTPVAEIVAKQLPAADALAAKGLFEASDDGVDYLASYQRVFLANTFNHPGWIVISAQSVTDVLAPVSSLNSIVVPAALLSILLVAYLGVSQIRKTLVPLDRLIQRTRDIEAGKFGETVDIDSDDEFSDLADSMNRMSLHLGRQIETLQAFATIDRQISARAELEDIAGTIILHITDNISCVAASIFVVDTDSDHTGRRFLIDEDQSVAMCRMTLSERQHARLLRGDSLLASAGEDSFADIQSLISPDAKSILTIPVTRNPRLCAAICIGFADEPELKDEFQSWLKDVVDRLDVALRVSEHDERLYRQGHYDSLTQLPNRQLLKERLKMSLAICRRTATRGALLFIDLDRFKRINDSRGHSAGDKLLQKAGERLADAVRESDTVARLGGDEFTVILSEVTSSHDAGRFAEKLLDLMASPFLVDGQQHHVSASIGIAVFPGDGNTVEDVLRCADTAMYAAKAAGRNRFAFYQDQMNQDAVKRQELESALHEALDREQLLLEYQPQFSLAANEIVGMEALIRWRHPDLGLVSPGDFIPIAEESGLIVAIGEWVLEEACRQYKTWQTAGIAPARIAVNVSPVQLSQNDFVTRVGNVLHRTGVSPRLLELEVTENMLLTDIDEVLKKLNQLCDMGVRIAIDDFGTGYSSMAYLNQLPFDVLKIDRSFVNKVGVSRESTGIVAAIIAVAQVLGKEIVAEGVETQEHIDYLRRAACQYGQGSFYSMPISAMACEKMLLSARARRAG